MGDPFDDWKHHEYAYVTTIGRRTGRPHRIEIWFAVAGGTVYLLSGGGERSDWVRNLLAHPEVSVEVGARTMAADARRVEAPPEDALARRLLTSRYQGWREGAPMSAWGRTALPVALDLR